jgi:putative heme-binding domain-containing protein
MRLHRRFFWFGVALAGLLVNLPARAEGPKLSLKSGDHISFIGNTLPDRMQHDGWLETHLISRFPSLSLSIRDMGYSGDELKLRLRSADFGTPDEWLTRTKTDVVFAFFGHGESYAGKEGLAAFKTELDTFIKHTRGSKYNGKSATTLVLFSPIAVESSKGRDLPDSAPGNERLKPYVAAIAEVAKANHVTYVDIFNPTIEMFAKSEAPLTINGIHLTPEGNASLAAIIDARLFEGAVQRDAAKIEKVRRAVLDKNFFWYNRYRTVDGFSIYGGRADLRFVGGQTNRVVAQREMEVLDVMTANRDQRIWAVANGDDIKVNDDNTPPFIPVTTNKPGAGPNGEHLFLGGEEAISKMTIGKGLKVNLFASEKEFPDLQKPVQMAFDTKGRLWVATWPSYPHWKPKEEMNDQLLIFEDTDGDGKADKRIVFADKLHCPTGFEFAQGGVIVAQAPDLMLLKDTNGDDKADVRVRILSGLDTADTHHTANSFSVDPGGAMYFQEGTFHHTQVETPYGPVQRVANGAVFRYEPKSQRFDIYTSYGFANPHGHAFDKWGQDIVVDGTGAVPYHGTVFSGHMDFPMKHGGAPTVYPQRTRPCSGIEYLTSRHFPEEFQGNLLVPNVIGFQGILRYKVEDKDSTLTASELEPILSSTDPNFRPADIEVGSDGAIYFIDWQNPIIGHMQHNLRDPSRDRLHGRIYRVTYEGRPLSPQAKIAGEPIAKILELMNDPDDRVRSRAKIELSGRDSQEVIAALKTWMAKLDQADPSYERLMMEALWIHQYHDVVNVDLLKRMLTSPDFHARAAATRVLCYWRDRVPGALELLKKQAADSYGRVRLEAVRASSFFTEGDAVEVPLISADHPTDEALDYTRSEAMRTLEPHWRRAIADGKPVAISSDAGARFFLGRLTTAELLKMPRSRGVDLELLLRKGVREEVRREAIADLAKLGNVSEIKVLLDTLRGLDESKGDRDDSVVYELARLLTSRPVTELSTVRGDLESLVTKAKLSITRQVGYLGLIAADGGVDKSWALAVSSVPTLRDFLEAVPMIRDPSLRSSLFARIAPLVENLPANLSTGKKSKGGLEGRFVRIELKGRRTLTLAEVEVMSDDRNVARSGKATQINTTNGGDASRAIDGNKNPSWGSGGQTHTNENTQDPWWELDLGVETPIESIVIYNRADGLQNRLARFTLTVFDGGRSQVFQATDQPAPNTKSTINLGGNGPDGIVRRAAINALVALRGHEGDAFKLLAKLVKSNTDRAAAVRGLLKVPANYWPADQAVSLVDDLLANIRKLPANQRTSATALDAIQLSDSLAVLLPVDRSKAVRKELGELGVRVIRLGTVTDQMLFDKERMAARAGKPVEILFENTDIMPHNFVVTKPGALEEVGLLGESTATQANAMERNYVPPTDKILFSSRLLAPRESQRISFTAPTKPGVYPYVCTYPGHWRRMYGAFYVVEDLDAYLADPEAYLSSHPLPILDDLLKNNRPRKEWKFEDLASAIDGLDKGRSFGNAKQMFQVASCVSCHQLNGVGTQIGQDLAKLDAKVTRAEILKSILEPSAKVDEKFQTHVFNLKSGKVVSGLILEETPTRVKILENPLAKTEPLVIEKSDIEERAKSPNSIMPKGLLDKMTREEILDLLAYVIARGDAKHPIFSGDAHDHGHNH